MAVFFVGTCPGGLIANDRLPEFINESYYHIGSWKGGESQYEEYRTMRTGDILIAKKSQDRKAATMQIRAVGKVRGFTKITAVSHRDHSEHKDDWAVEVDWLYDLREDPELVSHHGVTRTIQSMPIDKLTGRWAESEMYSLVKDAIFK